MKALSFHEPWGSLVAFGEKRIETRSWPPPAALKPPFRLAIHTAAKLPDYARECMDEYLFRSLLAWHLPALRTAGTAAPLGAFVDALRPRLGCIVGYATVVRVRPISLWAELELSEQEYALGDYQTDAGRFAWYLADAQALATPIPAKGNRLLWEWDPTAF